MKQIMMIVFTFFALTLISCSTDKDDSADKDKKEDTKKDEETGKTENGEGVPVPVTFTVLFESKNIEKPTDIVSVTSTESQESKTLFSKGDCAEVTAKQFKTLKISAGNLGAETVLCDNSSTSTDSCVKQHYKVVYYSATDDAGQPVPSAVPGYKLIEADSAAQNCNSLITITIDDTL